MNIVLYAFVTLIACFLIRILLKYLMLWPAQKGIRVLMYHHIKPHSDNDLIVSCQDFENQLIYLNSQHYQYISCSDLIDHIYSHKPIPKKSILITFDDAYTDFNTYALPILNKYNAKAIIFVPTKYIGDENRWDNNGENIMGLKELSLLPTYIELGLHSHEHKNFKQLNIDQIESDLTRCFSSLDQSKLDYTSALAYPYGGYYKSKVEQKKLFQTLHKTGVKIGFRIGNRINKIHPKNIYTLQRLDIKGSMNLSSLYRLIKYGKLL
ncbi:MAG: polysaccharide deacetylase family protein [Bacteroidetes bacterium]|nr:polysaccharide deacetylase family protein [Bacteroidota bacterium]